MSQDLHAILKTHWGYDSFRPLQEDIMRSVLNGDHVLTILPTGGGKSLCYQVPALAQEGICIVVSPLIALMKDQVNDLKKRGIRAVAIYSGMSQREIDETLETCIYGNIKFLYLSPERLVTDIFRTRVANMNVSMLAIDEAHCISQWGYDFRPAYLNIADIRELIPAVPVIALTATATPAVKDDILEKLRITDAQVYQASFARKELAYVVRTPEDKYGKMLAAFKNVKGSGIVYVRNRKKTREIANILYRAGISASYYHAGLKMQDRTARQDAWIKGEIRVMVCTNAFGMGINKPDVRVVVHVDLPDNIESYYQEAGRAGRDGKRAFGLLLVTDSDIAAARDRMENQFPSPEQVVQTYNALGNYLKLANGSGAEQTFDLDVADLCRTFDLSPSVVMKAFSLLEEFGLLTLSDSVYLPSKVHFLLNKEEMYKFQIANRKFDPVIKALLRSYPGVFDEHVPIKEKALAEKLGIQKKDIEGFLKYMHQAGVVEYSPASDAPRVTYMQARKPGDKLGLDKVLMLSRQERYKAQLEGMINYVTNTTVCRTRYFQQYFGEETETDCGVCDICLEREADLSREALDQILADHLRKEPLAVRTLLDTVKGVSEHALIQRLRNLIDDGQIEEVAPGMYQWKG